MEETKLFKIGEVAKMLHVSMGTLRHYEQAGLLTPEYVDRKTDYRYYSARQLEVLNTIRYLRVLDMPLPQIADFLQNGDVDVMREKLLWQKEMIREKKRELEHAERKIDHRLERLNEALQATLEEITIDKIPAGRLAWIRDKLQLSSYLDLEYSIRRLEENQKETLVFLGKVGVGITEESLAKGSFSDYKRVFLLLDEEDAYEGETEEFPEMDCVMIRFRGSHKEAPIHYEKLIAYMKEYKLVATGFSREITLIDNGLTDDPEKFVTEIRIPVQRIGEA